MGAGFCDRFLSFVFLCAVLHRLVSVYGCNSSSRLSLARIPSHLYHTSNSLLKEVKALVGRHEDKLTMETLGAANKGYSAEVLVVTYNHVNDQQKNDLKFRILLSFGQHGREIITTEVALHLLLILSGELRVVGIDPTSLRTILDNLVVKVVPMENANGRILVERGDLCERRNGRGVDLNRNWSIDWGKKEKDYDPYEENPGTAPFSEPEAQIMRLLSKSFNPHIWALFMPYDHKNTTPDGFTSQLMKLMLEELNHQHFQGRCLVGSGGGSVGYLAHGTTTDYMNDVANVPMSFTFEIYGDTTASSKDCFKMFNPVDAGTFKRVLSEWSSAFLTLFKAGPEHLKSKNVTTGRWISFGDDASLEDMLAGNHGREKRNKEKIDGLDFGMREMRTYFRLFMVSSVLLLFMFCSRISKSKCRQGGYHS
ncbi:hypothetical protein AXF42_Ash020226 [Apostasia shenzhenica]|uniref:Peptidase M14 domain-containing protein n=1 Tax=Apostasia shenzhenica TaxID=1088818 RepID=A0A2H9ZX28_9ASPA|nr:hypothetical protein AXF42_Ash020226 [Apostasia shenzhenica]